MHIIETTVSKMHIYETTIKFGALKDEFEDLI